MRLRVLLPILLPILLSGSVVWGRSDEDKALRDLGPDKKICLCAFRLLGADAEKNSRAGWASFGGIVGSAIAASINANAEDSPYAKELSTEFQNIFERALRGTGAFQLSAPQGLIREKNGKPLTLSGVAAANDLFACVTAQSGLGVGFGFKKKVKAGTKWELTGSPGWQLEIETEATSEEGQDTFPNPGDPKYKPVMLQLARDSARQFVEQLSQMMKDAGSPAEVTIVDLDEVPVGTLLDPGTFPQPEPECALNSDGKWEKRVALGNGVDLALVYIPNGSFVMGSDAAVDDEGSHPQHQVTIGRAFWMGKFEVTQAQWKAIMGTNPSKLPGDDRPVDSVSWNDAVTFLGALNQRLGRDKDTAFRLPTEAEWEYACRTGTTTKYSFSDSAWNLAKYAWFEGNSSSRTHPVGLLRPNAWGVFDMYGNVTEWCQDAWHSSYEGAPTDGTAWTGEDQDRVLRGGHWDNEPSETRSYSRYGEEAKKGTKTGGFRLVVPALHSESKVPTPAAPDAAVATPQTKVPTPAAPDAAVATPEPKKKEGVLTGSSTSVPASMEAPAPVVDEKGLQPGMTFQQVEETIGRPAWRAASGKFARWAYGHFSVYFEDGRVVRIESP